MGAGTVSVWLTAAPQAPDGPQVLTVSKDFLDGTLMTEDGIPLWNIYSIKGSKGEVNCSPPGKD